MINKHFFSDRVFLVSILALIVFGGLVLKGSLSKKTAVHAQSGFEAVVTRRAPQINGRVEGSVRQLSGEGVTLNGGSVVTGDYLVPGTPQVRLNGQPNFGGVVTGTGNAQPTNYQVTLNGNSRLGRLFNRIDPFSLPNVAAPPASTGTRDVTINNPNQAIGDPATIRDLTLNGGAGTVTLPPGTYRNCTVNGTSVLVLGVAGQKTYYNFQNVTVNGSGRVQVSGPVQMTLNNGLTLNGPSMGASANPAWLLVRVANGGVTVNGSATLYGSILAPNGGVTVNNRVVGNVSCDRITVNGSAVVSGFAVDTTPPRVTITEPAEGTVTSKSTIVLNGTILDENPVRVTVNGIAATVTGMTFSATVPLNEGENTLSIVGLDSFGNTSSITQSIFKDSTSPVLNVISPEANQWGLLNQTIIIEGNVTDPNFSFLKIDTQSFPVTNGHFRVEKDLLSQSVQVVAEDLAGNQSIVNIPIRFGITPGITFENSDEGIVSSRNYEFKGVITGTNSKLFFNGNQVQVGETGLFSVPVNLVQGLNNFVFRVEGILGKFQNVSKQLVLDSSSPELVAIQPLSNSSVPVGKVNILGSVRDENPEKIYLGNVSAKVNGTDFIIKDFDVKLGVNRHKLVVKDLAGNQRIFDYVLIGTEVETINQPVLFPITSPTRVGNQFISGKADVGSTVIIEKVGGESFSSNVTNPDGLFFMNLSLNFGQNFFLARAKKNDSLISSEIGFSIEYNPEIPIPPPGTRNSLTIGSGDAQRGVINLPLARPLVAFVSDRDGNPVENVAVNFFALSGEGKFSNDQSSIAVKTDVNGYASVGFACGQKAGLQYVMASFEGNVLTPALFFASVQKPTESRIASFTGNVLDQNLRPLPNVIVRLSGQELRTDTTGSFTFVNIPVGPHQILEVIGRDQVPFPGRWPNISYDIDIYPGIENRLGRPIFLPRVNEGISLPLDQATNLVTREIVYQMPVKAGEEPVVVKIKQGTKVTFPPDISDKRFSVTRIPVDRVPMTLENGRATNMYISVQPSGAVFDPPLEVSFPNSDRLNPNVSVLLMSFNHEAGRFVHVGEGKVDISGRVVTSNPGQGIHIGAWHAFPPPSPPPSTIVMAGGEETGSGSGGNGGNPCSSSPSKLILNTNQRKNQTNPGTCYSCDVTISTSTGSSMENGEYVATVPSSLSPTKGLATSCRQFEPEVKYNFRAIEVNRVLTVKVYVNKLVSGLKMKIVRKNSSILAGAIFTNLKLPTAPPSPPFESSPEISYAAPPGGEDLNPTNDPQFIQEIDLDDLVREKADVYSQTVEIISSGFESLEKDDLQILTTFNGKQIKRTEFTVFSAIPPAFESFIGEKKMDTTKEVENSVLLNSSSVRYQFNFNTVPSYAKSEFLINRFFDVLEKDSFAGIVPAPQLSGEIVFIPDGSGNYIFASFIDQDGDGKISKDNDFLLDRKYRQFSVFEVNFKSGKLKKGLNFKFTSGPGSFSIVNPVDVDVRLEITGKPYMNGSEEVKPEFNKIKAGVTGVLTKDTITIIYPIPSPPPNPNDPDYVKINRKGLVSDCPGNNVEFPPLIEAMGSDGVRPFMAEKVFRETSRSVVFAKSGGSEERIVTSKTKTYLFDWLPQYLAHPKTFNIWGEVRGDLDFTEYVLVYSDSFPKTYIKVCSANWLVNIFGKKREKDFNYDWVDNGSSLRLTNEIGGGSDVDFTNEGEFPYEVLGTSGFSNKRSFCSFDPID